MGESSEPRNLSDVRVDLEQDCMALSSINHTEKNDHWVQYSIEWRDLQNRFKSRHPATEQEVDMSVLAGTGRHNISPAFERISVFRTKSNGDNVVDQPSIGLFTMYYVRIHSVPIIHALRSVVKYYPGQDLNGNFIDVPWPYPILVHHYDELSAFREELKLKEPEKSCVRELDGVRHIDLLLGFLDKEVMIKVNEEKERNKRGYYTFDYRWVSLKRGATVITNPREYDDGEWTTGVIHSVAGGIFGYSRTDWSVSYWSMAYDGEYLGRELRFMLEREWDGEVPCEETRVLGSGDDFEESERTAEVLQAIECGKTYWEILRGQCRYHSGKTVEIPKTEAPKNIPHLDISALTVFQVQGLVMVDINAYYDEDHRKNAQGRSPGFKIPILMTSYDQRTYISDCPCRVCTNKKSLTAIRTALFEDYNSITLTSGEEPTDHLYFLCPKKIPIFVFKTRTWGTAPHSQAN